MMPGREFPFSLYLVTDRNLCGGRAGLVERVGALARGLDHGTLAVQVREKDLETGDLLELVGELIEAARPFGVPVLVNDRADVALAAGADGVHLPATGMSPGMLRGVYRGLIGVSTHSVGEIDRLAPGEADFATIGPVFDTPSKRPYGPPLGPGAVRSLRRRDGLAVFAIGGIKPDNVDRLEGAPIDGVAVISAVLGSDDPVRTAAFFSRRASGRAC